MKPRTQRTAGTQRTKHGRGPSVLGVLAVLAVLSSAPLAAQQAPAFEDAVDVNVVNVDVYVTGKDGRPVTGLDKGDFKLYVDGKRVEITNFEAVDRTSAVAGAPAPAPAPSAAGEAPAATAGSPLADALHLVVYVDNFNLRTGNRARALQQLRDFLTRQLVPGDKVTIVSYDLGLNVRLPFTSDPEAIAAALDGLNRLTVQGDEDDRARRQAFREIMTIQEASIKDVPPLPCPRSIATPAHSYASARRQEVLRTFSALTLLVNSLSGLPGRKAVLHVSDGISITPGEEIFQFLYQICGGGGANGGMGTAQIPNRPPVRQRPGLADGEEEDDDNEQQIDDPNTVFDSRLLGPSAYPAASQAALDAQGYSVAKNVETLAAHANAQRVTLYTLQTDGAQATVAADASYGPSERLLQMPAVARIERSNRQDTLTALASATGGRAFLDSIDLRPDLARLREDFDRYYSLAYSPSHPGDGKEHRIEVKVKLPGANVRSRQSYRDKPALEQTLDRTLASLLYDFEDNPLDVSVEIGEQTAQAGSRHMVPVYLRIPLFKLRILSHKGEDGEESYEGRLRLFVATRGAGGLTPIRQVDVPIEIPQKEVLMAMGQYYGYTLSLDMAPGEQQIAVAVRDELTTTTSYLSRSVNVGAAVVEAASQNR
jgi:VWFA-related protein